MRDQLAMQEQHTIKDRIKPPFHSYPPSSEIPHLPILEPEEAVVTLMHKDLSRRVIKNRHVKCLREIITTLIETKPISQDFDEVVFQNLVIEQGDLTELVIPFELYFLDSFFLNGLHLNHSHFVRLDISGYIGYALSLTETKGQPKINLNNVQADQVYVYGGEGLEFLDVSISNIGRLTLASTTIKRQIFLRDTVNILDGLGLENLSVEQDVNLIQCSVHTFFRIHNVHCSGDIKLIVCDLNAPLSTKDSSCVKLSLSESKCSGRLDFRNLSFQEIDLSNTIVAGQLFLNLSQLQRRTDAKAFFVGRSKNWDTPPCLSPQKSYTLRESVSIAEQLIVLRENFRRIPIAGQQEEYCAYQLADAAWEFSHGWIAKCIYWIAKKGFGYLLLPLRVVLTMIAIVVLFGVFYAVLTRLGVGNLVFSDGKSISQDGVLLSILRSLYFSVVTFSTLGYGDIHPVGLLKAFAATEAFTGLTVAGLFTVSLARRIFRW